MTNTYDENQKIVEDLKARSQQTAETTKQNKLEQNQNALDKQTQTIDVISQRLAKYIPTYNKAQGVTGGLAETTKLKANTYAQNLYADTLYQNSQANLQADTDYQNKMLDIENDYATRIQTARAQDNDLANEDLNSIYDAIDANPAYSETDKTKKKLEAYNQYKDYLGANTTAQEAMAKSYEDAIRVAEEQGGLSDEEWQNKQEAEAIDTRLTGEAYNVNSLTSDVFEKFFEGTSSGWRQNTYMQRLYRDIKNGKVPDGSIISCNYGASGNFEGNLYMLKNGKLYKFNPNSKVNEKKATRDGGKIYVPDEYYIQPRGAIYSRWGNDQTDADAKAFWDKLNEQAEKVGTSNVVAN